MGLLEGRRRKKKKKRNVEEVIEVLKATKPGTSSSYREQSLKVHGMVCAKCGREFEPKDRHLLTVHHKDGNPRNNPSNGSNWENLCVYCHDDEHSRGLLGDYITGKKD
ncbi:MAG TPA: HNH nuclease family protein [Nitrospirae bacterium]|nr:HNH nuclease family protein [Nitrospirota bacterium]